MMKGIRARSTGLLLLVLAGVVASCDTARVPTEMVEAPAGTWRASTATAGPYEEVEGDDGFLELATAVIGPEGGRLALREHLLEVPSGAVSAPTTFTMRLKDLEHIEVDLRAVSVLNGVTIDVGAAGFARPVQLTLSYSSVTEQVDEGKLLILWARPSGDLSPVPSEINASERLVRARIDHFSGYVIGTGRDGDPNPDPAPNP